VLSCSCLEKAVLAAQGPPSFRGAGLRGLRASVVGLVPRFTPFARRTRRLETVTGGVVHWCNSRQHHSAKSLTEGDVIGDNDGWNVSRSPCGCGHRETSFAGVWCQAAGVSRG
jgi:hypothetical protein